MSAAGIAFITTIVVVVCGGILCVWVADNGLPISWQQKIEKLRKSFFKTGAEYTVDIMVESNGNQNFPFTWNVSVQRKDGEAVYRGRDNGVEKTQELCFKKATARARKFIEMDMKRRKPTIKKSFTL